MLKFISKTDAFRWLDEGLHTELGWAQNAIHLKTWQDIAVYAHLKGVTGKTIGEIGGGDSRILHQLKNLNTCFNIDKFEGADGGPATEIHIPGVTNIRTFLGEFNPDLPSDFFDIVYSVSVIEHVPENNCDAFLKDLVRILKPGGLSFHAIDLYVGSESAPYEQGRVDIYRDWLAAADVVPLEEHPATQAIFHSSMISNPDLTMWHWSQSYPAMRAMREAKQSVSLLLGFRKAP